MNGSAMLPSRLVQPHSETGVHTPKYIQKSLLIGLKKKIISHLIKRKSKALKPL